MMKRWQKIVGLVAVAGSTALASTGCGLGEELLLLDGVEMEAFSSCSDLEQGLKQRSIEDAELRAFSAVTGGLFNPGGFTDGADGNHSETNTQEEGVDEADLLKVDDRHAYAIHHGHLVIVEALGEQSGENFQIEDARQVSELKLEGQPFELYIEGNRALVMARTTQSEVKETFRNEGPSRDDASPVVKAILVDITDRSAPKLLRELILEGQFLSSRRIGDRAYLVMKSNLKAGLEEDEDASDANWLERRRAEVQGSSLDGWLPSYYDIQYRGGRPVSKEVKRCSCRDAYASPASSGDGTLSIYTIDLDRGDSAVSNSTIVGDGTDVYASKNGIVVAVAGYRQESTDESFTFDDDEVSSETQRQVTFLHRFALGAGPVKYNASGVVDGWILNQFALSERAGYLRIATQTGERGSADAESNVFTLKLSSKSDEFFAVGGEQDRFLKVQGELRGIGAGEDMYAARFMDDRAFLVTFQATDPLWHIDMSNPEKPRLKGELHVPGYSTYLHPVGQNRLLAVGRSGTREGDGGIKLSVFDISRDNPTVIHEKTVGNTASQSEALTDHRAFRYLPKHNIMALPIDQQRSNGLQLYNVDLNSGIRHLERVDHSGMVSSGDPTVRRTQRIGDHLFALSAVGLSITDLNNQKMVAEVDLQDE